jgi:hypothetical protein
MDYRFLGFIREISDWMDNLPITERGQHAQQALSNGGGDGRWLDD